MTKYNVLNGLVRKSRRHKPSTTFHLCFTGFILHEARQFHGNLDIINTRKLSDKMQGLIIACALN